MLAAGGVLPLAVAVTVLVAAAPAGAATTVAKSGTALSISAAVGKPNNVSISLANGSFTVSDSGDTIAAGFGCSALDAHTTSCAGAGVYKVVVFTSDLDDKVVKTASTYGWIYGGSGDDTLNAGPAAPRGTRNELHGGPGADMLRGGPDDDLLDGGPNGDVLSGGTGHDAATYAGPAAVAVTIDGVADDGAPGEGDNVKLDVEELTGSDRDDILTGSAGANVLSGGAGADDVDGLTGDDVIDGGAGDDALSGGDGRDVFREGIDFNGADAISGGAGFEDHVDYTYREAPVRIEVDGVADDGEQAEGDDVGIDVEHITGGYGSDVIVGSAAANVLGGGDGGSDTLDGRGGSDTLLGGRGGGADVLSGGDGEDLLDGGRGPDVLIGGAGRDRVDYATRTAALNVTLDGVGNDGQAAEGDDVDPTVENISGGSGDDTLTGSAAGNRLAGGDGHDRLFGVDGADHLDGGRGEDLLRGGLGNDSLLGWDGVAGNDTLDGQGDSDACTADLGDFLTSCES